MSNGITNQLGRAVSVRFEPGVTPSARKELHEFCHFRDKEGPYAKKPNKYREKDPNRRFDDEAEAAINRAYAQVASKKQSTQ